MFTPPVDKIAQKALSDVLGLFNSGRAPVELQRMIIELAGSEENAKDVWTIAAAVAQGKSLAEGFSINQQELESIHAIGLLQQAEGQHAAAIKAFGMLALLNQQDIRAHKGIGRSLRQLGEPARAATNFAAALMFDPDDLEAMVSLAECRILAGDGKGLAALVEKIQSIAEKNAAATPEMKSRVTFLAEYIQHNPEQASAQAMEGA